MLQCSVLHSFIVKKINVIVFQYNALVNLKHGYLRVENPRTFTFNSYIIVYRVDHVFEAIINVSNLIPIIASISSRIKSISCLNIGVGDERKKLITVY